MVRHCTVLAAAFGITCVAVAAPAPGVDTLRSMAPPARLSVAYLLKIRDVPGLRGVADSVDRADTRRLDEANESAAYFRVADSAWVTHDDTTIAEVRDALDGRDLAEHRLRNARGGPGLEQERRDLERRRRDLERRRRDLESRRSLLRAETDRARRSGLNLNGFLVRERALDNQVASLRVTEAEIVRAEEALAHRAGQAVFGDPAARATYDRAIRRSVTAILTAMRRAIARGRATAFAP